MNSVVIGRILEAFRLNLIRHWENMLLNSGRSQAK